MSEYQYYEFAAIERPLSRAEMAELRALSSRAEISPAGFVNHYEWGDLKADPADWMRRYFDAFVYTACWCTCRLALRLPRDVFRKDELGAFAVPGALSIDASAGHWIIQWSLDESEDYDRFGMDDGRGWMRRLAPLRDELLRGDLRPLYLGWLAGLHAASDAALEPELPAGLSALSPAQQALAEFLDIDPDLLAVAAAASPPAPEAAAGDAGQLDAWLASWPREAMREVLKLLAQGRGAEAERLVRGRHVAWLKKKRPAAASGVRRRSVAELFARSEAAAILRQQREEQERATAEAERRRQREACLRGLIGEAEARWEAIDAQARRGTAAGYEEAVRMLKELAEAHALMGSREAFEEALQRFLLPHAKRAALLRRLSKAGLGPQ